MSEPGPDNWLLYDGECPFCSRYVKLPRLRRAMSVLRLVNARGGGPEFQRARTAGFDLNEGMLLRLNGQYWHGEDCVHHLALMSTPSALFNRGNAAIFKSRRLSRFLCPFMRFRRNLTLAFMGRRKNGDRPISQAAGSMGTRVFTAGIITP